MRFTQVLCVVSGLIAAASAIPQEESAKRWKHEPVTFKGNLKITAANGTFIGFVSKTLSHFGTFVAEKEKHKAATFSFKAAKFGKSKDLLLKVEAPEYAKTPFLGAVIQRGFSLTTGKGGKRAGTAASASSAASGSTNPNQPPSSVPNSFDPSGSNAPPRRRDDESEVERSSNFKAEASIWTFDPRHNRITGSFVNPDKKPVTVALHYNPHSPPGVDLVSDVHAYKAANPKSFAITVEFVSH